MIDQVEIGWCPCTLGDILTLHRGYDLPERERRSGSVPVVSSSGVTGYHDVVRVKGPGVVTGRYGTLGEVFYVEEDYWPLNTTLFVSDFKGNDPRFVSYFLRTLNFGNQNAAGAVPGVNRNHLHLLPVRIPTLPIQRKIAAILSAYDDLIENNTRRIAILEEMAQALYREWFVHFRFPGHQSVPLVDSPLGPIPEGWQVVKLGNVAQTFRGRSYTSSNLVDDGGLPFLNLKCIDRDGGFRHDGIKQYLGPYKEGQVAHQGDIIVAVTDMTQERRIVARAARVPPLGEEFSIFSMDLVKLAPIDRIPSEYIYGMLRYSSFPDEVKQYANGANVLHLNPERIESFQFNLPSEQLRQEYAQICGNLWEQSETLEQSNANLRRTRDLLLPKLVSGELDVEGLEIAAEELNN